MIVPTVREDMRGFWGERIRSHRIHEIAKREIRFLPAPPTTNNNMDFGNDTPDYDPDDFDNYDYE